MDTSTLVKSLRALVKASPRARDLKVYLDGGCCLGGLSSVEPGERTVLHSGGESMTVAQAISVLRRAGGQVWMTGGCEDGPVQSVVSGKSVILSL